MGCLFLFDEVEGVVANEEDFFFTYCLNNFDFLYLFFISINE